MLFNTLTFVSFFLLVLFFYYLLPKSQKIVLIAASIFFYGFWNVTFLFLLLASIFIDFNLSKMIEEQSDKNKRKIYLLGCIVLNLSLLFYFKYANFALENVHALADAAGLSLPKFYFDIVLPLGISFYTFEAISYMVDVYERKIQAERNFLNYASFILFFPKLIAGPVIRASEFLPQIANLKSSKSILIYEGIEKILTGLFLKVVLADNIAPIVDDGFLIEPSRLGPVDILTLTVLFGFQIYFDFAGYSSIAIGCANLLGYRLPENFNFPYISKNPREFWLRWNISLSSWIKDYLYIPLSEKFKSKPKRVASLEYFPSVMVLMLTWGIMGLWHGANWTFLVWGLYHACLILIYRVINKINFKFNSLIISIPIMFILIMIGWLPFRAENLDQLIGFIKQFTRTDLAYRLSLRENTYLIAFVVTAGFFINYYYTIVFKINKLYFLPIRIVKLSFMMTLVFVFFRPISQFIYFQF